MEAYYWLVFPTGIQCQWWYCRRVVFPRGRVDRPFCLPDLLSGEGCIFSQTDIKEAYRIVPVHPDDQRLLWVTWENHIFSDTMLPFGLRSAPKIFNAIADAAQWIVQRQTISHLIHYFDDYALVASSENSASDQKRLLTLMTFEDLGIPLESQKLVGPSQIMEFLGIEVDSITMQLRLPQDKLERLISLVSEVVAMKSITRKQLQRNPAACL